ncbi:MAG: hypothetical protein FJ100_20605 [Deltaproteobacteria bacterium]|nr:hypothetical protein [Deltaproteobacteria bacterium]
MTNPGVEIRSGTANSRRRDATTVDDLAAEYLDTPAEKGRSCNCPGQHRGQA